MKPEQPPAAPSFEMPRWITLQLLENCNLKCRMCYEWGTNGSYPSLGGNAALSLKTINRLLDECLPSKPYVELFGGEPLLYPHLEAVIRRIKVSGAHLEIPTNGTLIAEHAQMLVDTAPDRLWISLDGPQAINDSQRGQGVFENVTAGIKKLRRLRGKAGQRFPEIGVTMIVTAGNHAHIAEFFLRAINLDWLDHVGIEFQNFITPAAYQAYLSDLKSEFGVAAAPLAKGLISHPSVFAAIDANLVARQIKAVENECRKRVIPFLKSPRTVTPQNYQHYFRADWMRMDDRRTRCGFPFISAEISARGQVTPCHTFYDLSIGNVHAQSLSAIWRGEPLKRLRRFLRKRLFSICPACCRYYHQAFPPTERNV
jgi:radical SAM protein with 4Fe4S-binding SPASM domain